MDRTLGRATTAGVIILCALIAANGVFSYRNLRALRDNMLRADKSHESIVAVDAVLATAKDLETGMRGFVITGKESYLDPYVAAEREIAGVIKHARAFFEDRPELAAEIDTLAEAVKQKNRFGREAIEARRTQGLEAASNLIASGEGKHRMDAIRAVVSTVREQEHQNLLHWSNEAEESYRTALVSLFNASVGGLALVGAIYYLIRREANDRDRAAKKLHASESRFRRLSESNVMGVLFADYDGQILEANDSFLKMIGYSREDLLSGQVNWQKLTPAEFTEVDRRAISDLKSTGVCSAYEKEYFCKDGTRVPILLGCAQLDDMEGTAICYAIDLTERKQAEATIQRLNRELQHHIHELETIFDLMPIGIAVAKDVECREITTNQACADMLGLARGVNASLSASASQRPKNFRVMRDGVEMAVNELPMQRTVATGKSVIAEECEIVRSDGVTLKLLEYVAPLFDDIGDVRGGVGVFIDITERKRLETQLRLHADYLENQQQWLQALLDLLPVPLLLIDPPTASVTFANRAAHEMAGGSFPLGESLTRYEQLHYCSDLSGQRIPPDSMPAMRAARGERLQRFELNWHLPSGDRSLLINADSLPAMHGRQTVAVLLFQDITGLKEVESELRRTNQAKDALLAMLGHELRNPLAAIAGSADVIATHSPEDAAYGAAIDILKRHITHLSRLVDDMLDLTRLTTGKIRLRTERVDLLQTLNHAVQVAQTHIDTRRHTLRVSLPAEPVYLQADRARLEQVFTNLMVNAAKYTEPGGRIELTATVEADHALVSVRDNGIGIDPANIPRMFDLFAQVNPTLDRAQAGLGIGLTVVRNLVDLHGGDVRAHSDGIGKGSEFIVRLPLTATAIPDDSQTTMPSPAFARTLKVLVVEDNPDIAQVMLALIKHCGHEAIWASTGPEALQLIDRTAVDVGLLDIGLPGMSGYELAGELKKNSRHKNIPLIALTGFGQAEDRRRSEEAGFQMHLLKPVSLEALQQVFQQIAD